MTNKKKSNQCKKRKGESSTQCKKKRKSNPADEKKIDEISTVRCVFRNRFCNSSVSLDDDRCNRKPNDIAFLKDLFNAQEQQEETEVFNESLTNDVKKDDDYDCDIALFQYYDATNDKTKLYQNRRKAVSITLSYEQEEVYFFTKSTSYSPFTKPVRQCLEFDDYKVYKCKESDSKKAGKFIYSTCSTTLYKPTCASTCGWILMNPTNRYEIIDIVSIIEMSNDLKDVPISQPRPSTNIDQPQLDLSYATHLFADGNSSTALLCEGITYEQNNEQIHSLPTLAYHNNDEYNIDMKWCNFQEFDFSDSQ